MDAYQKQAVEVVLGLIGNLLADCDWRELRLRLENMHVDTSLIPELIEIYNYVMGKAEEAESH